MADAPARQVRLLRPGRLSCSRASSSTSRRGDGGAEGALTARAATTISVLSEWVSQAPGRPLAASRLISIAPPILRWFRRHFSTPAFAMPTATGGSKAWRCSIGCASRPEASASRRSTDPLSFRAKRAGLSGGAAVASYVWPGSASPGVVDRDSGQLRFYAQALDRRLRADIDPPVELDPAALPADDRNRRRAAHRAVVGRTGRPSASTARSPTGRSG